MTPWWGQFAILFRRTLKEQWRKRGMLMTQLVQSIIIAILIGTVFLQIGTSQTSTTRRQPVLFFCAVNQVGAVGGSRQVSVSPKHASSLSPLDSAPPVSSTMPVDRCKLAVLPLSFYVVCSHSDQQLPQRQRASLSPLSLLFQGVFGALIQINSFPSERALSLRERAAGTYYASAYFLAKTTAETFTQIVTPIIFSLTVYFLIGLQAEAGEATLAQYF